MVAQDRIRFGSLNVEGLNSFANDVDLPAFICKYDIVFFCETFTNTVTDFFSHTTVACPGIKVSDSPHGRLSGGVTFYIRKSISKYVRRIPCEIDNIILLKLSRNLLGSEHDTLLIGIYLPPEHSPYYADTDIYNGVSMLEDCLLEIVKDFNDIPIIMCGDFNARTSNLNSKNIDPIDEICQMHDNKSVQYSLECTGSERLSCDTVVNSFGKYLLDVCEQFGLIILNGLSTNGFSGDFTYVCQTGCSVVDYFIVSRSFLHRCISLKIIPLIETKHLALELFIDSKGSNRSDVYKIDNIQYLQKYKWNSKLSNTFVEKMKSSHVDDKIRTATELIDTDVNMAILKFNECFTYAGECMMKRIKIGSQRRNVWFDLECSQSRKVLFKHLSRVTRSQSVQPAEEEINNHLTERESYVQKRREYKSLLKSKRKAHRDRTVQALQAGLKDPKMFWDTIRAARPSYREPNTISKDEWYDHFNEVFNSFPVSIEERGLTSEPHLAPNERACHSLNIEITTEEISVAIKSLKNNKAAGPDGFIGEFFKNSIDVIQPFLAKYFNYLFDHGLFPEEWSVAILQPIHKKGNVNIPDNYRGISLLNICSKLYSFVLNKRIKKWVEDYEIVGEEQCGFRSKRSTTEQVFVMQALVQKQLLRHRKLYACFIDFKKAFDSVNRKKLWNILHMNGMNGKMLNALKSMYNVVKSRVRVGADVTDDFFCPRGLKQGEICSPILFSMFINELTKEIITQGKHGIQLTPELIEILILLFADDVVLVSDTVVGLQCQLNILYNVASKLDLIVNLDKSNVIVFRNGGHLAAKEKWTYGESQLEVVNMYKYLGIYLSTRLSFSHTQCDLASKARNGTSALFKLLWSIGEHSPGVFFKLFDAQIKPILTYGSEIWGLVQDQEEIERVHLSSIKRFLGLHPKAPRQVVYGESGRYPLYICTYIRCIKFWLHLASLDRSRYPSKAYKMLLSLQSQNYTTWACSVRNILFRYGFGVIWEAQSVGNEGLFIRTFRQRLIDCFEQNWRAKLQQHDFFSIYSSYRQSLSTRIYVIVISNFYVRKTFAKFCVGMSPLKGSFLKYKKTNNDINCPFCFGVPETEIHFLFICPKYTFLRQEFIPRKYLRNVCLFKLSQLMACTNVNIIEKASIFVYKALDLREKCM